MLKIHILPDIVANKIAAGEVVERPASVVKELVENAIDSGADIITVEIEKGGGRLIRVSDNGEGMSRDDALLSLERHATSKIEDVKDIENIVTLGFRGEALPSIVSVSKTTIDTKTNDEVFGTRLEISGGVLRNVTDSGRDAGTDVEVKNLFYNLPARRKFMKSEQTELKHIKSILYDAVISRPALSLTLIANGRELFAFRKSADRMDMLTQVLGKTLAGHLVPVSVSVEGVAIEGYIGSPEATVSGFNQFIIVNGRPVRSKSILRAVLNGYGPTLSRGTFPVFVLYFSLDPHRVDVNIHPSKREIRIYREFSILEALTGMVSHAVQSMAAAPSLDGGPRPTFPGYIPSGTPVTIYNPPEESWYPDIPHFSNQPYTGNGTSSQVELALTGRSESPHHEPEVTGTPAARASFVGPLFIQLDNKYIITTTKGGAIFIDQHIAHERILYEEVLHNLQGKTASGQQLLFPMTLDFSAADFDILEPMLPHLNKIGFGIREFGERSVMIDAIPSELKGFEDGKIINEFIEEMRTYGKITSGYIDKLAASLACRAAIKAGDPLNQPEMQYLVDRLFATQSPFVCPHGRPTIVKLSLGELDRRFGR